MEFIELCDICKTYRLGEIEVPVLKGVSLSISRGEFVALMGTSGSGKTTLMNILGCLDHPTSGQYRLDGDDVVGLSADEQAVLRNQKIGFVFQNFNLLPRTSALENVMMPLTYAAQPLTGSEARKRAEAMLLRVRLENRLDHEPSKLSGGEQQRVAIARALIYHPPLLFADEPTGNLDSRTSDEVLRLFKKLNEDEGVTVILVTHDENVARYARRVIRIQDGVVEGGETSHNRARASAQSLSESTTRKRHRITGSLVWAHRILRTALAGLRRNVMRAALTTLGIIIGIAAVIAMMEIGRGSSTAIQQTIASMGANNLLVSPGTASSGGVSFGAGTSVTLAPQDADAVLRECPAIRAVAPIVHARTQVVYGNRNWVPATMDGTTAGFLGVRDWNLAEGDPFTDRDVRNANKVCILGQRLVKELFQGESPIGKEVRVNNVPLKVIGSLTVKGANMMGMDQDDILLAPWTTIKYRVTGSSLGNVNQSATGSSESEGGMNTLSRIYPGSQDLYPLPSVGQTANTPHPVRFANVNHILAAARSAEETSAAIHQITQLLRERHRIHPGDSDDFHVRDMTEVTKALSSTATLMTKLLLVVALISLIVGGVGIMNIMLVSVTERTHEIGLRMAVGAPGRAILQQFLAESVVLCFFGGIAGILVGRGISYFVRVLLQWPTELSLDAILAAFVVSATIGVVFGFYPAWRASRLDPIIALRRE
jgi:macrolide transport system ATP-binding/permease protein